MAIADSAHNGYMTKTHRTEAQREQRFQDRAFVICTSVSLFGFLLHMFL